MGRAIDDDAEGFVGVSGSHRDSEDGPFLDLGRLASRQLAFGRSAGSPVEADRVFDQRTSAAVRIREINDLVE